jgi:hypothetical protein
MSEPMINEEVAQFSVSERKSDFENGCKANKNQIEYEKENVH